MPKGQMVVGRVVQLPDGTKGIEPLHAVTALDYQQRVATLIEAARQYADAPSAHHLYLLKQAAHGLRTTE